MNKIYPKDLFELQADFVNFLVNKHKIFLDYALFKNTSYYVRIIGHSDENEPDTNNLVWKDLIHNKPESSEELAEYFYSKYLEVESRKEQEVSLKEEPCFHVYHHKLKDFYELHLDVNDPKGILSTDRIAARTEELKSIFLGLKNKDTNPDTKLFARTWLFNIEAFTRLFPESFSISSKYWNEGNKSYDNAHWGQFLTRDKNFKTEIAEKFRNNWETKSFTEFNLYFPYPAKFSEVALSEFYDYYDKID